MPILAIPIAVPFLLVSSLCAGAVWRFTTPKRARTICLVVSAVLVMSQIAEAMGGHGPVGLSVTLLLPWLLGWDGGVPPRPRPPAPSGPGGLPGTLLPPGLLGWYGGSRRHRAPSPAAG